jgi:hypothetical protein
MRSDFAVVPTEGFNPARAKTFTEGVEATLACRISVALIFDRDYRSDSEVTAELSELKTFCDYAHIHSKKELENFLLVPAALNRAITQRIAEQNERTGGATSFSEGMQTLLLRITDALKHDVQAQYLKRQQPFARSLNRSLDDSTVTSQILAAFDDKWADLNARLAMVSGKEVLSRLNAHLQKTCGVAVTPNLIIEAMNESDIASEMKAMIASLDQFAKGGMK